MGDWPTGPRKVAVANGSGSRWSQGFAAGAQIIRWEYTSFLVDITGNCWAVPNMTGHDIFHGLVDYLWAPPDEVWISVAGTRPYDNAPGGWRDTMAQLAASDPGYGDITTSYPNHCFIPTVSALALDTTDLFYDIAGDPDLLAHTPFDAVYYPALNQEHVDVTAENAAWFLAEIEYDPTASVADGARAGGGGIASIAPNPFASQTQIRLRMPVAGPARLDLFDVTGRRIAVVADGAFAAGEWTIPWDGRRADGTRTAPGTYFLRLSGPGFASSGKIVVSGRE